MSAIYQVVAEVMGKHGPIKQVVYDGHSIDEAVVKAHRYATSSLYKIDSHGRKTKVF